MIFVLVMMDRGNARTGDEYYFQELSSCLEVKNALIYQSTAYNAVIFPRTNQFKAFCEVRQIDAKDAGVKYIFRDDQVRTRVEDK